MRRQDADHGDAGGRHLAARDGERERERGGRADDRALVAGAVQPLRLEHTAVPLDVVVSELLAEGRLAGLHERLELVGGRSRELDLHGQKISGHQGATSVRKSASARSIAPAASSVTRPARASCLKVKPPR